MSKPPPLDVGDVVAGRYRVETLLGRGGMGAVFSVVHVERGTRHALKLLTRANRTAAARFLREGRAASALGGRRIPAVHDQGEHHGVPFMVIELLEGEDLERRLSRRRRLPIDEAVGFIVEACAALAPAHAHGFVHRDIKPANLFVARRSGEEEIVLLDFGVAKDEKADKLTATNTVLGSPQFISPEQLLSSRDVDHRADIWSLGATLFELLTGASAFPGRTVPDLCRAILREPPRASRTLRADIPEGLEDTVRACLRKSPDERPQNVGALAEALVGFTDEGARAVVAEVKIGLRTIKTFQLRAQEVQDPDPEGLLATRVAEASTENLGGTLAMADLAATEFGAPAPPATWRAPSVAGAEGGPATAPEVAPMLELPAMRIPTSGQRRREGRERRTRVFLGVFLVVLVLAAIVGWWFGRRGSPMMGRHASVGTRPDCG